MLLGFSYRIATDEIEHKAELTVTGTLHYTAHDEGLAFTHATTSKVYDPTSESNVGAATIFYVPVVKVEDEAV